MAQLVIKRNDTSPPFTVDLEDGNGDAVNLQVDDAVVFSMRESTSQTIKVTRQAAVFTPGDNRVEYRWQAGDTDTAGEYEAEWEVTFADGTVQTFPGYDYDLVIVTGDIA